MANVPPDLTGTAPEPTADTLAGVTHMLTLKTAYYNASVPIWLDLISAPAEWSASFLASEAKEVLDVLGGLVLVFPLPMKPDTDEGRAARELIQHVGKVVQDGLGGWAWDGVSLCLGVGEIDQVDEWDECAAAAGLEFVQIRAQASETRNEFGGTSTSCAHYPPSPLLCRPELPLMSPRENGHPASARGLGGE